MRLLCTGDLHVGRRCSRIPAELDDAQYTCAAAWEQIVEHAIAQKVDAVLLSGDVVDHHYYEAYGPIERGLRRLGNAGIRTFAVAGNHDHDVLPRLADSLGEAFRLVGAGGMWERVALGPDGRAALYIDGWSFPNERVSGSPLAGYGLAGDGVPTIGLLHADLDQAQSPYAPVSAADLRRAPVSLWVLGHVHAPKLHDGSPGILYPGSPLAMDPGETGRHGPWMISVEGGRVVELRQAALSRVRYERVEVGLEGVDDEATLQRQWPRLFAEGLERAVGDGEAARCVCCRVVLRGRTRLHRRLGELAGEIARHQQAMGRAVACIEKIEVQTSPQRDLRELAGGRGLTAMLAQVLLEMEGGQMGEASGRVLAEARRQVEGMWRSRAYAGVAEEPGPDAGQVRQWLVQQAWMLLDTLLAQKEGGQ